MSEKYHSTETLEKNYCEPIEKRNPGWSAGVISKTLETYVEYLTLYPLFQQPSIYR